MDSVTQIRLTRELVDIDSTTGREGRGRRVHRVDAARTRVSTSSSSLSARADSTSSRRSSRPSSCSPRTSTACRRSFPAARAADACTAADRAMRRARWSRRLRRPNGCARRRTPRRPAVRRRRRAGQRRREAREHHRGRVAGSSSTASRPTTGWAGRRAASIAFDFARPARAAHSSQPELGESAIEKLIDALVEMRGDGLAEGSGCWARTYYTVGLIRGGVAPNVIPPEADAEVMFRTVGDASDDPSICSTRVSRAGSASRTCSMCRPCGFAPCPDSIPRCSRSRRTFRSSNRWGEPLLVGPGFGHARAHGRRARRDRRSPASGRHLRHSSRPA